MVNWRDIPILNFENTNLKKDEKDHELVRLCLSLNIALVKTFSDKKYKKFALFFTCVDEKDGFKIQIICPEAEFIHNLKKLLSGTYNLEETASIFKKLREDFTLHISNLHVGENIAATVVYDEQAGEITLGKHSLQMDFTTTSGLLFFLASMCESGIMEFEEELIFENYNLRKFIIYYLDEKNIEFSRLKINVDNYEEWDYYYPEYDKEVEEYKSIYKEKIEREFPEEHFQYHKKSEPPKNEEDFLENFD